MNDMRARIGVCLAVTLTILLLFGIGQIASWANNAWLLVGFPLAIIAGIGALEWTDEG